MSLNLSPKELAHFVERALLRPDATRKEVEQLCAAARENGVHGVCVNGSRVVEARHFLADSEVKVICVAGFPMGAGDADVKRYEVETAIDAGAQEIDLVLNHGRLKEGDDAFVLRELRDAIEAADERPVKVLLETALLERAEIVRACHIAGEAGALFVGTLGGLSGGTAVEDLRLLREATDPKVGIKASGVRDLQNALELIEAGANRLGIGMKIEAVP